MPPKKEIIPGEGIDTWGRKNIKKLPLSIPCVRCGSPFAPRSATSKYCSPACGYANNGYRGLSLEELYKIIDDIPLDDKGCKILYRWNNQGGYPVITISKKRSRVSHLVLTRKLGRPLTPGLFALHTCDTPACVNENHLYEGNQKQNIADARARNRLATGERHGLRKYPERAATGERHGSKTHPERIPRGENHASSLHPELVLRGERNGNSKLLPEQVLEIRSAEGSLSQIAARYNIGKVTVLRIKNRDSWAHLP